MVRNYCFAILLFLLSMPVAAKECKNIVNNILRENGGGTFDRPAPSVDKIPTPAFSAKAQASVLFKGVGSLDSLTYFKPKSVSDGDVLLVEVNRLMSGKCWVRRQERIYVNPVRCTVAKVEQEDFTNCEDRNLRSLGEVSQGTQIITRDQCGKESIKEICRVYFQLNSVSPAETVDSTSVQLDSVKIVPTTVK